MMSLFRYLPLLAVFVADWNYVAAQAFDLSSISDSDLEAELARRAEINALKAQMAALQAQIEALDPTGEAEPIETLAASASPTPGLQTVTLLDAVEGETETSAASEEGASEEGAPSGETETISTGSKEEGGGGTKQGGDNPLNVFEKFGLGYGLALRHNLSGDRVKSVTTSQLADGTTVAQISQSDEQEIRVIGEGHFLFKDRGIFSRRTNDAGQSVLDFDPVEALSSFALCGLFAWGDNIDRTGRRGCGPFIMVAVGDDQLVAEFGIGHMVSFGEKASSTNPNPRVFNLGYGVIFDPDSETLDNALFEPGTLTVRENYVEALNEGSLSLTTKEETLGAVILFSTNF